MPLEIEILSDKEAAEIWQARSRRAADFNDYLDFLNIRDVGKAFRVKVPQTDQNAEEAKKIKYNFGEAAKERVRMVKLDHAPTGDDLAKYGIDADHADLFHFNGEDKAWYAEIPSPVVLRWKANSHVEKRQVTANGKKAEVEVKLIDSLEAIIVASDTVRKRGPRHQYETVDAATVTVDSSNEKAGKTADGRAAKLSKTGKWRAVKAGATDADHAAVQGVTANGTAAQSATDGNTVDNAASVGVTA